MRSILFKFVTGAVIFGSVLSFPSCSGNAAASSGKDSSGAPASSGSSASSSAGDASFSYTLDGVSFSGKGTDDFANCVYRNEAGKINFVLMDISPGQKGVPTQMHIFSPDNGTATFKKDDAKYSVDYRYQPQPGQADHNYDFGSMTVTILSNTASHVSGTFSGTFVDQSNNDKVVQLTDGKFDIPYSSHSPK